MKKAMFSLMAMFLVGNIMAQPLLMASFATTLKEYVSAPVFSWSSTSYDFGLIEKGVPVTHEFTFVNSGSEPLIILSVKASCGCTVTDYSKDAIQPGASGYVKATYNAAKPGSFTKTITVLANADVSNVVLSIKGEVKE